MARQKQTIRISGSARRPRNAPKRPTGMRRLSSVRRGRGPR